MQKRKAKTSPFGLLLDFESIFPILHGLKPSEQVVLLNLYRHRINTEVVASQSNLIAWTGIKSANTIKAAIKGLMTHNRVRLLKPGQQNSPAVYSLPGPDDGFPEQIKLQKPSITYVLNTDNRLRLAIIKKNLSTATWSDVKKESSAAGSTEDEYLIQRYFGPERLREKNT